MIRRILVDHARARHTAKRGSDVAKLSLDEAIAVPDGPGASDRLLPGLDLLSLDDALTRLAEFDPQQGRIVELRFFAGLSIEETAEVLGISPATVKRDWVMAKAWLFQDLTSKAPGSS